MSQVLVVGGAGYVGGGITDRLIVPDTRCEFTMASCTRMFFLKLIDFTYGDVRDRFALEPHLDWADSVVWLSALVGDGACSHDLALTSDIEVAFGGPVQNPDVRFDNNDDDEMFCFRRARVITPNKLRVETIAPGMKPTGR